MIFTKTREFKPRLKDHLLIDLTPLLRFSKIWTMRRQAKRRENIWERVGLTDRAAAKWLLHFAGLDFDRLDPQARLEARLEVQCFLALQATEQGYRARLRGIPVRDSSALAEHTTRDVQKWLHGGLDRMVAIAQRIGLPPTDNLVLPEIAGWHGKVGLGYAINSSTGQLMTTYSYDSRLEEFQFHCLKLLTAHLIRLCQRPDCRRPFVVGRGNRQIFHSMNCMQTMTARRFRQTHREG